MSESQKSSSCGNARNIPSEEALDEAIGHFLKEFPEQKKKIEMYIQHLLERADEIDKTNKHCTIASITANSGSAVSGILTILGLALVPVTAGGSLILSATGMGLGIASGVASVSAGVSKLVIHSEEQKKSQEFVKECEESLRMALSLEKIGFRYQPPPDDDTDLEVAKTAIAGAVQQVQKVVGQVTDMATHVDAIVAAKATPALATLAKEASAVETVARNAIKGIDQVDEVFKGTALAASKGARVAGAVVSGMFLGVDAYYITKDAIHLSKGAKTEKADNLRAKAETLEKIVQELSKFYMELKEEWD